MIGLFGLTGQGQTIRDNILKFGYALRGMTPVTHRFLSRGKRTNVIAALSSTGIIAIEMSTTTVNGDRFFDFVRGSLVPNMLPFNGSNSKSILVLDNCSVHHIEPITTLLREAGIIVLFLPPYSPVLNPAEEVFSCVKTYLKRHDTLLQTIPAHSDVIKEAFHSISQIQLNSFITHAGYLNFCGHSCKSHITQ